MRWISAIPAPFKPSITPSTQADKSAYRLRKCGVVEVFKAVTRAVERARKGEGPSLIECKTYRFKGHAEGDPDAGLYRTKDELAEWKKRDPIQLLKQRLMAEYNVTEDELTAIEEALTDQIKEAINFAKKSPFPKPESALEGLFEE